MRWANTTTSVMGKTLQWVWLTLLRPPQLLLYLSDTSPECLLFPGQLLNVPAPCPTGAREAEERLFSELLEEQEQCEMEHWSQHISNGTVWCVYGEVYCVVCVWGGVLYGVCMGRCTV